MKTLWLEGLCGCALLAVLCGCAEREPISRVDLDSVRMLASQVRTIGVRMRYISGPLETLDGRFTVDGGKGYEAGEWFFDEFRLQAQTTGWFYVMDAKRMLELQEKYLEFKNGRGEWAEEFAVEWVRHPEWTVVLDLELEAGYGRFRNASAGEHGENIVAICAGSWSLRDSLSGETSREKSFVNERVIEAGGTNSVAAAPCTPRGLAERMARSVASEVFAGFGGMGAATPELVSAHPLADALLAGAWIDAQEELSSALAAYESGASEFGAQEAAELYYLQGWLMECRLQRGSALEKYAFAQQLHADERFEKAARRLSAD